MILLFRFVIAIAATIFRRRSGLLDEAVTRFTVLPNDCDLNLHLNGGRFLSFMDIARVELLARMGALGRLVRRGWRPIMGATVIRYRRSILPFERFTIRTRVLGWDEKWFYLEHVVEKGEELCATGTVRTLFRGREGILPPSTVLDLFGAAGMPSPPLPELVARWRELENAR